MESCSDDELEVVYVKLAPTTYQPLEEHLQRKLKRLRVSDNRNEEEGKEEKLFEEPKDKNVVKMEEAGTNFTTVMSVASYEEIPKTGRKGARELNRRENKKKKGERRLTKRQRRSGDSGASQRKKDAAMFLAAYNEHEKRPLFRPNSDVSVKEEDFPVTAYSTEGMSSNVSDEQIMKMVSERAVELEKRVLEAELSKTLVAIEDIKATPVHSHSSIGDNSDDVQGSQSASASWGLQETTEGHSGPPSSDAPEPLVNLSVSVPAQGGGKSLLTTTDSADVEVIYVKIADSHKRAAYEEHIRRKMKRMSISEDSGNGIEEEEELFEDLKQPLARIEMAQPNSTTEKRVASEEQIGSEEACQLNQSNKKQKRPRKLTLQRLASGGGDSVNEGNNMAKQFLAAQKELEEKLPLFRPNEPEPKKEEDFPFEENSTEGMSNFSREERMKTPEVEKPTIVSQILAVFKQISAMPGNPLSSIDVDSNDVHGSQSAPAASWGLQETTEGHSIPPSSYAPEPLVDLSVSVPAYDIGKGSQSAASSWGLRETTRGHSSPPSESPLFDLSRSMMTRPDGEVPFLTQLTNHLGIPAHSLPSLPSLTLSSSSAPNYDVDLKTNFMPGDNLMLRHVASHCASGPLGCAFDNALKMWLVADSGNNKVVLLDYDGNRLHSIDGFVNLSAIAVLVPGAEYAVLDDNAIWSIDLVSGTRMQLLRIGRGYRGLCVVSGGYLATLHTNSARLCILNRFSLRFLSSIHLSSQPENGTSRPSFLCARGEMVYVTDLEANVLRTVRVKEVLGRIECSIVACCDLKKDSKTAFSFMSGIFADSCHTLFVCDARHRRAFLMSPTGAVIASVVMSQCSARPFFPYTSGVAVSPQLRIMLCGRRSNEVSIFDIDVQRCERSQLEKDVESLEKTMEFAI